MDDRELQDLIQYKFYMANGRDVWVKVGVDKG